MKQVLSGTGKCRVGDLEFGMATAASSLMCLVLALVCFVWIFSKSFISYFAASCSVRLQIINCHGSFMATVSLLAETVITFHLLDDLTDVALHCTKTSRKRGREIEK